MSRRVVIMGLDSVPPRLLFEELAAYTPNLRRLWEQGASGPLRSCHPPITVPAWQVLAASKNPGRLGLYGFRHRRDHSYTESWTANTQALREPALWDVIARVGKRSCLVGVPPGYPPRRLHGWAVSCFLTPRDAQDYTYPRELQEEVESVALSYRFDVPFRVEDRETLRAQLFEMTRTRFALLRHLARTKPWDFFMFVEIGFDRLHHAFWKFFDRTHPKYTPGNPYERIAAEYYALVDEEVGELLALLDDAVVIVASDHGSKGMAGAFCINEWLAQRGYLALDAPLEGVTELDRAPVAWDKTVAWGWGGYYARVFLNVKGREPQGVIDPQDYNRVRQELAAALRAIPGPDGQPLGVEVLFPEQLYPECRGDRPDLMVYFGGLSWRSAGTLGHGTLYLSENDTGPDDSVHDFDGVFVLYDPQRPRQLRLEDVTLLDIAPTVLEVMGVPVPADMEGRSLLPQLSSA